MASNDMNIVVASMEVELGIDLCTAKLVKEVCDEGDQVLILPSDLLRFQKSTQSHRVLSFFLEKRTGVPDVNWDNWMNPLPSISSRNS